MTSAPERIYSATYNPERMHKSAPLLSPARTHPPASPHTRPASRLPHFRPKGHHPACRKAYMTPPWGRSAAVGNRAHTRCGIAPGVVQCREKSEPGHPGRLAPPTYQHML